MRKIVFCFHLLALTAAVSAVKPTKGEPWPKPQQTVNYEGYVVIRPSIFTFKVTKETCDILEHALKRYYQVIYKSVLNLRSAIAQTSQDKYWKNDTSFKGYVDELEIQLMAPCEDLPYLDMDEHYELRINSPDMETSALLTSQTIWGILRGLETFTQLLSLDDEGTVMKINSCSIMDFPRYSHRGLLLDTSRHFYPVDSILLLIDGMEVNKLNVFHWHIVDDTSFPYESAAFPDLSEKGAFNPRLQVYTREDIREVIEYARVRGIRVLVEFDTPGHTLSWGPGVPGLLTPCYQGEKPDGTYGPINPIMESTYTFLEEFFKEALIMFPDDYIHLGGDEVSFDCWASNPEILAYMESVNITGDFKKLEGMYVQKLVDITTKLNGSSVVWQEVFDNGVILPKKTVVHVWKGGDWKTEMQQVTEEGYNTILSSCWYLDSLASGGDWQKYYECDPNDFDGTAVQKQLVMGGEACMWSEYVDPTNLSTRVWPRACAAAERLWSNATVDVNEAIPRLEEHVCRMNVRGIPTQPANGPGNCPYLSYYHK